MSRSLVDQWEEVSVTSTIWLALYEEKRYYQQQRQDATAHL